MRDFQACLADNVSVFAGNMVRAKNVLFWLRFFSLQTNRKVREKGYICFYILCEIAEGFVAAKAIKNKRVFIF